MGSTPEALRHAARQLSREELESYYAAYIKLFNHTLKTLDALQQGSAGLSHAARLLLEAHTAAEELILDAPKTAIPFPTPD